MAGTVGSRIEAIALQKGLPSGKRLADLLGVSYETLRKWREDQAAPNRSRQAVIAERLGVAPEAFMFGAPQAPAERAYYTDRFSAAARSLARQFDAVPDGDGKVRLLAQLEDLIRVASLPRRPSSSAATDGHLPKTGKAPARSRAGP